MLWHRGTAGFCESDRKELNVVVSGSSDAFRTVHHFGLCHDNPANKRNVSIDGMIGTCNSEGVTETYMMVEE